MIQRKVEILAPAGSIASMEAAVCAGADAVYMGGSLYGARAYADNPNEELLLKAIDYVHLHGRKIYLTVNTLIKDKEMENLYSYLLPYYTQGLDAVIVQDIGVLRYIKEQFPNLSVHISTQAAVTNELGASFFKKQGADRIVPARELSLEELRVMKEQTNLELECFVHGAMCYCYSGQCLLSSMIGGRSGNRGQCAQPCRLPYAVHGKRPADLLSLKDLCTIEMIPELVLAGIDSFKIEGRMKQPDYVYTVVRMYRKYTDLYLEKGEKEYFVSETDKRILESAYVRRGYESGYYKRQNGKEMLSLKRPKEHKGACERSVSVPADYKIKEKINGKLIISSGKCVKLWLEYKGNGKHICKELSGEVAQNAEKAPLERERIEKQIRKTGNTEYAFDKIEIELGEQVFLPMQSLNTLRREGLDALEKEILSGYKREAPARIQALMTEAGVEEDSGRLSFEALVQTEEQFFAAADSESLEVIYVDGNLAFCEQILSAVRRLKKKRIYAAMPYIFRTRAIAYYDTVYEILSAVYDGVLIRNWESFEWLKRRGYAKKVISDSYVYVFNRVSKAVVKQEGICRYTCPAELNFRELKSLRGGGILTVYGYQPVMITANCIKKTTGACSGQNDCLYLTDRRGKRFAVKNDCRYCYNVIYNCEPLLIPDMAEELKTLKMSGIRLDFVPEKKEEVQRILRLYEKAFFGKEKIRMPQSGYTRGHIKRGVK